MTPGQRVILILGVLAFLAVMTFMILALVPEDNQLGALGGFATVVLCVFLFGTMSGAFEALINGPNTTKEK
jgi:hypothetical protein